MVRFKHISSWLVLCAMCMSGASGVWAWNSLQSGGRCKQTNISCRSTIGNAGGSGSCCDPRQSNILTCETQNECQGGSPHKWKTLPYQWQLNLNNMAGQSGYQGISASQIESATKLAHDAWTKPTCTGFTHKYNGQTSSSASTGDRKNVVFLASPSNWAQMGLPSAALAVTRPIASGSTLYDTDIVVNPVPGGRPWGITPNVGRSNMDYADVMAHEVGHALGFGHAGPKSSLMYFSIRGVGPLFSGLSSDEEAGVCTIYPVTKCSSDTQCGGGCRVCTNGTCQQKTVSPAASACKGCTTDAQCGSGAQCVNVGGQMRCLTTCVTGDCCPSGNTCKSLSGKRVCTPDSGVCPALSCSNNTQCGAGEICAGGTCQKSCQNDSECPTGSGCRNNVCTQLAPGKLGQPCSSQLPCESGLSCFQTSKGQLCSRECGSSSSAGFPAGQQGAQCNGSSCDNGASCVGFRSSAGTTQVCITRCTSSTVCNNVGGKCFQLSGSNFAGCFCQSDSDCKSGQSCNKTVLGQIGLSLGACGTPAATTCPSGYACTPVSGKQVCVPGGATNNCGNGTCDAGETCTSCAQDCGCPSGQTCQGGTCQTNPSNNCGNGTCDANEDCTSCAQDCPCVSGKRCNNGTCETFTPPATCGNGTCDATEDCTTCAQDCPCGAGKQCTNGVCLVPPSTEPTSTSDAGNAQEPASPDGTVIDKESGQKQVGQLGQPCKADGTCEPGGFCYTKEDGSNICLLEEDPRIKPAGCGCHTPSTHIPLSLTFFLLFLFGLRRRHRSAQ